MPEPGIEPGLLLWEAGVLTITPLDLLGAVTTKGNKTVKLITNIKTFIDSLTCAYYGFQERSWVNCLPRLRVLKIRKQALGVRS